MSKHIKRQLREPETGRYALYGDLDRACICGHTLGIHIAGGHECCVQTCDCQKFRLKRGKNSE